MPEQTTYDFGTGPVPAHQHRNLDGSLGGWVADSAFVHPTAWVLATATIGEWSRIGAGSRIGEWSTVGAGSRIGEGSHIGAGCHIGDGCTFGWGSTIGAGSRIGDGSTIGAGCTIGENGCTFTCGPIGSRHDTLTAYWCEDATAEDGGGIEFVTGCFLGTAEALEQASEETHGINHPHTVAYRQAIALLTTLVMQHREATDA